MDLRTDRVGLLLDQLESWVGISRERLAGLTDEEYRWEPAPGAWSVHRRGEARSARAYGPGEWVLDHDRDPDPPPVTTIAWRLGHLVSGFAGRWEWTFGSRSVDPVDLVEFTPSAAAAVDQLWAETDRWIASVGATTDEQLDTPGFGQYPYGLDPQLPFVAIVWWVNREFIHHAAEAALLRDLYAARAAA
jgi:hypothetical protein